MSHVTGTVAWMNSVRRRPNESMACGRRYRTGALTFPRRCSRAFRERRSAEPGEHGRSASDGGITPLGVGLEERCGRWLRGEPADVWRKRVRNRRRAGEVARDACRAVRLVVHVVKALGLLLDVRSQLRWGTTFTQRHHRGDEQLHQAE